MMRFTRVSAGCFAVLLFQACAAFSATLDSPTSGAVYARSDTVTCGGSLAELDGNLTVKIRDGKGVIQSSVGAERFGKKWTVSIGPGARPGGWPAGKMTLELCVGTLGKVAELEIEFKD